MSKSRKKRKAHKRVLPLPNLEQAKSAILKMLTSKSGQRTTINPSRNSSIGTAPSSFAVQPTPLEELRRRRRTRTCLLIRNSPPASAS